MWWFLLVVLGPSVVKVESLYHVSTTGIHLLLATANGGNKKAPDRRFFRMENELAI
jgi:hypothetical protein